jgi:hypothetical protein
MKPKPKAPLYVRRKPSIVATSPEEIEQVARGWRGPRENVMRHLNRITVACYQVIHGPHGAEACALAKDVRALRKCLNVGPIDPELADYFIEQAMLIGSAFEKLRADVLWRRAVRAGEGTMKGGGSSGGDHSALKEWARKQIANGSHPRGLAAEAVRQRMTNLTERQARNVLQAANIVPRRLKRK